MSKWKDTFRFSLSLQMVGMTVLLVLACTILVRVYAGVIQKSQNTRALSESIQVCRNLAEQFEAAPDEGWNREVFLNSDLTPCDASQAYLRFVLTESSSETATGQMRELIIDSFRVADQGKEPLYSLSVRVFVPGEGDGYGY